MRLLVFGRTGQVATELRRAVPGALFLGRDAADLADPVACVAAIGNARADAVINAAAWTAVDAAETEREAAFAVNGTAPAAMANACARRGLPFVHISTDYVFDGSGDRPWRLDDPTGPLGTYGASKLAGEDGVRAAGGCHAILRTSWVFSAHGTNFVKTMLRLGAERDRLRIVADQVGGPTPAAAIAGACIAIARALAAEPALSGTYHFSGAPDVSWAGFAGTILESAGLEVDVEGIPTSAYPTPAPRPLNSCLDCSATEAAFGIGRPDWRAGLDAVIDELEQRA
jgi:dTDP-4-dehydrorhamnose reductase